MSLRAQLTILVYFIGVTTSARGGAAFCQFGSVLQESFRSGNGARHKSGLNARRNAFRNADRKQNLYFQGRAACMNDVCVYGREKKWQVDLLFCVLFSVTSFSACIARNCMPKVSKSYWNRICCHLKVISKKPLRKYGGTISH